MAASNRNQLPGDLLSQRAQRLARQYTRALQENDNSKVKRFLRLADHDADAFRAMEYVHGRRGDQPWELGSGPWETDEGCIPGSTRDEGCEV